MNEEVAISLSSLKKSYGEKKVLKGISLTVYKGELFGFIGKNGAGKSTTIDCIIGTKRFDEGKIEIYGHDVVKEPIESKRMFGYAASEPNCYNEMTGYEYLDFIASIYNVSEENYKNNTAFLSRKLELSESDLSLPTSSYSHGMRQKLCLIASLLHQPKLWILDEPTVGLDVVAVDTLVSMMRSYSDSGETVFLTSHNIELVSSLCDRVAIINNGVVASLLDLKSNPNLRLQLKRIFLRTLGEDK